MSTIALPPTATPPIVCPSWCTVPMEEHIKDLPAWEGRLLHWSDHVDDVRHARSTFVDNTIDPDDPPMVHLHVKTSLSLDDAEVLARRLLAVVEEARA